MRSLGRGRLSALAIGVAVGVIGALAPVTSASAAGSTTPGAPENVSATAAVESVTLTWAAPTDDGGGLNDYLVSWTLDGTDPGQDTVAADQTSYTFSVVGGSIVAAQIVAQNDAGDSTPAAAPSVEAQPLLVSSSVSGTVIRPYKDGYQDTVAAKATTNAEVPVTLQVLNSSSNVVRSLDLGTGVATGGEWTFQQAWNGRDDDGARVPVGSYRVRLVADWDGPTKVLLDKSVTVALSQVGKPKVTRSVATVYPTKDGYRDAVTFKVTASLPAHGTLKVTRAGKVAYNKTLPTGRSWKAKWNGRLHGKVVKGSYHVTVSLKGGEGKARTHTLSEKVSPKHLVTRTKTTWYSATSAIKSCLGSGTFACTRTTHQVNGAQRNVVRYSAAADPSFVWAVHALPLPKSHRVLKWRLSVEAATTSRYYVILCANRATDQSSCTEGGYLPNSSDGLFMPPSWTKTGVADGRADFAVASDAPGGTLYVSRFRIEVKYQVLV